MFINVDNRKSYSMDDSALVSATLRPFVTYDMNKHNKLKYCFIVSKITSEQYLPWKSRDERNFLYYLRTLNVN